LIKIHEQTEGDLLGSDPRIDLETAEDFKNLMFGDMSSFHIVSEGFSSVLEGSL
jgi:hypothetical protein